MNLLRSNYINQFLKLDFQVRAFCLLMPFFWLFLGPTPNIHVGINLNGNGFLFRLNLAVGRVNGRELENHKTMLKETFKQNLTEQSCSSLWTCKLQTPRYVHAKKSQTHKTLLRIESCSSLATLLTLLPVSIKTSKRSQFYQRLKKYAILVTPAFLDNTLMIEGW